jgi:hypothetical protein
MHFQMFVEFFLLIKNVFFFLFLLCLYLYLFLLLFVNILSACKADKGGACIYCWRNMDVILEDTLFVESEAGYGGALWFGSDVNGGSLNLTHWR